MKLTRILLAGFLFASATPAPIEAGILKDLKKVGKEALKTQKEALKSKGKETLGSWNGSDEASSNDNMGRSIGNSKSGNAASGTNYISTSNKEVSTKQLNYIPDSAELNAPKELEDLHPSTAGGDFTNIRGCFHSPKQTSTTVHLTFDDTPDFGDFYEGIAYINAGKGNCFYINNRGEKLFDSYITEHNHNLMPRFYNGKTLEQTSINGKKAIVIRDKAGKDIKTITALGSSPYFVNGVAAVVIGKTEFIGPFTLKYINTNGDFIFDNLSVELSSSISSATDLAAIMREESEGLTAVMAKDPQSGKLVWGFRNQSGAIAITPKYAWVGDFHDGMAMFLVPDAGSSTKGKWGFIDKSGRELIPASFSNRPSDFNSGYARVTARDGAIYLIDKNGNKKRGPYGRGAKEGAICYITPFVNGRAIAELEYTGMGASIYVLLDENMDRLAWGRIPRPNINHKGDHLIFSDNKLIYFGENSTSRCVYWLDPSTMDLQNKNTLCNPYVNGYSRYSYQGEHGYVDENFNFTIKFENNEF